MSVSFAVTAYKETTRGGPTILQCVEAAVQHPQVTEIVVVDDASPDFTKLKKMVVDVPKLKLFQNEKNLGVFGNKLSAVAHCSGEWVINSDSDNIFDEEAISKVLSCDLDPMTWYCPSFAKPVFDYRKLVGRYNSANIAKLVNAGGMADCLMNTGNQTVHRDSYMAVFGQYFNERADLLLPNYLGIPEAKRKTSHWRDVFNACDSLVFNSIWINGGGTLDVVQGFEYDHYWTSGSDSNYNRAPTEKGTLSETLLAGLGKEKRPVRPVSPVRQQATRSQSAAERRANAAAQRAAAIELRRKRREEQARGRKR